MTRAGGRLEIWGFGVSCIPKLGEGGGQSGGPRSISWGDMGGNGQISLLRCTPKLAKDGQVSLLAFFGCMWGVLGGRVFAPTLFARGSFLKSNSVNSVNSVNSYFNAHF